MRLVYRNEDRHPVVRALLADQLGDPEAVSLAIAAEDEMLHFALQGSEGDWDQALAEYFRAALGIAATVKRLLGSYFGGLERVGSLLDFASGFGRVSRFLPPEISRGRLWMSDIVPEAMEFARDELGAQTVPSAHRAEDFSPGRSFDAITVVSLFTHLPRSTFGPWLHRLLGLLEPGGLLLFTAHDMATLPRELADRALGGDDLRFVPESESKSLDKEAYGSTWVAEAFVRSLVAEAGEGFTLRRYPGGMLGYHDLYAVARAPARELANAELDPGPRGYVEKVHMEEGRHLRMSGWAVASPPYPAVERVTLAVDGTTRAECRAFGARDDVARTLGGEPYRHSGWELRCDLGAGHSRAESLVLLKAASTGGVESLLFAGTLEAALLRCCAQERHHLLLESRRLWAERGELEASLGRARADQAALEARIAAMEASRFWQARNLWFRLKRLLGLTAEP